MKNYLILLTVLFSNVALATTDYQSTIDAIEAEETERTNTVREKLPSNLPFANGATTEDVTQGQETGQFSTARSRTEGEPSLHERVRARMAEYLEDRLTDLEKFEQDSTAQTDLITRNADGDDSDGTDDVLAQLNAQDKAQHGPKAPTPEESKPAFAKASSNRLNSIPHAASQQGDPCQSKEGNSASMEVAPITTQYDNACDAGSLAEISDCSLQSVNQINSESKGGSANSTQVFEPTKPKVYDETQNIGQAEYNQTSPPSCPTQPRLAESKMQNIASLVTSDRAQFEQSDLVASRNSSALAALPKPVTVAERTVLPWYKNLLAWVLPNAFAQASTIRGQTNTTGRANEVAAQNFAKLTADLKSHRYMAGEQEFANRMSSMMEEYNKVYLTKLDLITQVSDNLEKISQFKHIEF